MPRLSPLLVVGMLLAAPTLAGDAQVYDAKAAFDAIKALEGEWVGMVKTDPEGEGREARIVYKVSANGHSVIETFAPGQPYEMFSVYHMDGDDLLMTHYCAIGNAPKMKFEPTGNPGELAFAFNGGTNLDPDKDAHAHEGTMRLLDADHYESVAIGYSNGEPSSTQSFSMRRVQ